jgi:hypothetical protein
LCKELGRHYRRFRESELRESNDLSQSDALKIVEIAPSW